MKKKNRNFQTFSKVKVFFVSNTIDFFPKDFHKLYLKLSQTLVELLERFQGIFETISTTTRLLL